MISAQIIIREDAGKLLVGMSKDPKTGKAFDLVGAIGMLGGGFANIVRRVPDEWLDPEKKEVVISVKDGRLEVGVSRGLDRINIVGRMGMAYAQLVGGDPWGEPDFLVDLPGVTDIEAVSEQDVIKLLGGQS